VCLNPQNGSLGVAYGRIRSQACPLSSGPEGITTRAAGRTRPTSPAVLAPCETPETMSALHRGRSPSRYYGRSLRIAALAQSQPTHDAALDRGGRRDVGHRGVVDALERLEPAPADVAAAVVYGVVRDATHCEHVEAHRGQHRGCAPAPCSSWTRGRDASATTRREDFGARDSDRLGARRA
jgi:hypothetical protein